MISCQVCWRTTRWHNGQIRRFRNPNPSKVFQDWTNKWEESVAYSIMARSSYPPMKAVYICADQPCPSHFSLAIRRRTIHGRMDDQPDRIREVRHQRVTRIDHVIESSRKPGRAALRNSSGFDSH